MTNTLGDVAVMMKRENGYWIFTLVCRLMVNGTLFYVERFFFYVFSKQRYIQFLKTNYYFIFVSQGSLVVVGQEK